MVYTPGGYTIAAQEQIVTPQAIDSARAAGVLDVLLDSVYVETPHLSPIPYPLQLRPHPHQNPS